MVLELRGCYILRMHSIDLDTVQMANHEVEARRMDRHCLDQVSERLHRLQSQLARMRRVLPNHQDVVTARRRKNLLLHAGRDSIDLTLVERNGQVGYLAEVISLLFLNAHFEHLALFGRVDQVVADLVHPRHGEVH